MSFEHTSVMPLEVLTFLAPKQGGIYLDGTLGGGGHASLILEKSAPTGRLIGLDQDEEALAASMMRLAPFGERVIFARRNFRDISSVIAGGGIGPLDGILLDLGVSSYQLDTPERGFSFSKDAPLDMRMDRSLPLRAGDLVNRLTAHELEGIIRDFGEERWARRIAGRIVEARGVCPIETTSRLADVVAGAIPRKAWEERIHPATRTFQALRIAVNDELTALRCFLADAIPALRSGGRIVVISFHSLEDRIVKHFFRDQATGCRCPKELPRCVCNGVPHVRILTGRPVGASDDEVAVNPRARSARLRAAEKC
jgi:16S rRNA (cytosine1402-N4)-methyltransferase